MAVVIETTGLHGSCDQDNRGTQELKYFIVCVQWNKALVNTMENLCTQSYSNLIVM